MPLHDWTEPAGWDGVHHYWITRLSYWLKPRLPPEYRAFVGSMPGVTVGTVSERPDVAVIHWSSGAPPVLPPEPPERPAVPTNGEDVWQEEPKWETATLT